MDITQDLHKRIEIVVPEPEQQNTTKIGTYFEKLMSKVFAQNGWKVTHNVVLNTGQIDLFLSNSETSELGLVECKFYNNKKVKAEDIDKVVGKGYREHNKSKNFKYVYIVTNSEFAPPAINAIAELESEDSSIIFKAWSGEQLVDEFMKAYNLQLPDFDSLPDLGHFEQITLLITHEKKFYWVVDETDDGNNIYRALIFPISATQSIKQQDQSFWKGYFKRYNLPWHPYDIVVLQAGTNFTPINSSQNTNTEEVTISKVNEAESFEDYHRPCRPEHFFGRQSVQDEFWNFIDNVKNDQTSLRVVCFPGQTGNGKSSTVLKLASNCFNNTNNSGISRKDVYLYHIDVTSINVNKKDFFIVNAIKKAFQEAVNTNFTNILNSKIVVPTIEPPLLTSKSLKKALEELKISNKVLVIFFDQFEEILRKPSLLSLYKMIEQFAYEVDSIKSNLVIGFSWRTDIHTAVDHPAYSMWHNLQKIQKTIDFPEFTTQESQTLVKEFAYYLKKEEGIDLSQKIKKWLINNFQKQPWLLKKMCGDILLQHRHNNDLSSKDLSSKDIITSLDIKHIFDKDIQKYAYTPRHKECLQFIALNSPIPQTDVQEKFNPQIVEDLHGKLIIETGFNYKIYWDIFREYLLEGKLPDNILSFKYTFRTRIFTAITILDFIRKNKLNKCKKSDIVTELNYSAKTINNALIDLKHFYQIAQEKISNKDNYIYVPHSIYKMNHNELAEHLAEQLRDHIIIQEIYKITPENIWIEEQEFKDLIESILLENKTYQASTVKDYYSKMRSWFCFAGLLETKNGGTATIRPLDPQQGKQKGCLEKCEYNKPDTRKNTIHPGQTSLFE